MSAIILFIAFVSGIACGAVIAYNAGYQIGFIEAKRGEKKWE